MRRVILCAILLAISSLPIVAAQVKPAEPEKLGNVNFPVSLSLNDSHRPV